LSGKQASILALKQVKEKLFPNRYFICETGLIAKSAIDQQPITNQCF
jgi:hypothetical protein